jgi:CRISPR-associated protein Cas1
LAKQAGVVWKGRNYDRNNWASADMPNRCISSATSCLYGISEAAVLAAGYAPAIGFIHTGKPLSFVYMAINKPQVSMKFNYFMLSFRGC